MKDRLKSGNRISCHIEQTGENFIYLSCKSGSNVYRGVLFNEVSSTVRRTIPENYFLKKNILDQATTDELQTAITNHALDTQSKGLRSKRLKQSCIILDNYEYTIGKSPLSIGKSPIDSIRGLVESIDTTLSLAPVPHTKSIISTSATSYKQRRNEDQSLKASVDTRPKFVSKPFITRRTSLERNTSSYFNKRLAEINQSNSTKRRTAGFSFLSSSSRVIKSPVKVSNIKTKSKTLKTDVFRFSENNENNENKSIQRRKRKGFRGYIPNKVVAEIYQDAKLKETIESNNSKSIDSKADITTTNDNVATIDNATTNDNATSNKVKLQQDDQLLGVGQRKKRPIHPESKNNSITNEVKSNNVKELLGSGKRQKRSVEPNSVTVKQPVEKIQKLNKEDNKTLENALSENTDHTKKRRKKARIITLKKARRKASSVGNLVPVTEAKQKLSAVQIKLPSTQTAKPTAISVTQTKSKTVTRTNPNSITQTKTSNDITKNISSISTRSTKLISTPIKSKATKPVKTMRQKRVDPIQVALKNIKKYDSYRRKRNLINAANMEKNQLMAKPRELRSGKKIKHDELVTRPKSKTKTLNESESNSDEVDKSINVSKSTSSDESVLSDIIVTTKEIQITLEKSQLNDSIASIKTSNKDTIENEVNTETNKNEEDKNKKSQEKEDSEIEHDLAIPVSNKDNELPHEDNATDLDTENKNCSNNEELKLSDSSTISTNSSLKASVTSSVPPSISSLNIISTNVTTTSTFTVPLFTKNPFDAHCNVSRVYTNSSFASTPSLLLPKTTDLFNDFKTITVDKGKALTLSEIAMKIRTSNSLKASRLSLPLVKRKTVKTPVTKIVTNTSTITKPLVFIKPQLPKFGNELFTKKPEIMRQRPSIFGAKSNYTPSRPLTVNEDSDSEKESKDIDLLCHEKSLSPVELKKQLLQPAVKKNRRKPLQVFKSLPNPAEVVVLNKEDQLIKEQQNIDQDIIEQKKEDQEVDIKNEDHSNDSDDSTENNKSIKVKNKTVDQRKSLKRLKLRSTKLDSPVATHHRGDNQIITRKQVTLLQHNTRFRGTKNVVSMLNLSPNRHVKNKMKAEKSITRTRSLSFTDRRISKDNDDVDSLPSTPLSVATSSMDSDKDDDDDDEEEDVQPDGQQTTSNRKQTTKKKKPNRMVEIFKTLKPLKRKTDEVKISDIVWGRCLGHGWWPGVVVSFDDENAANTTWFYSNTKSTMKQDDIKLFLPNFEKCFKPKKKSHHYVKAVIEALDACKMKYGSL